MNSSYLTGPGDIIHLNVGGERFSTSKQTLSWMPDTFFTSLLSGRISTLRDDSGAIFIDRDPGLFRWVLQYLRTREIATKGYDIAELRHEAEFYGVSGLVKRLSLCQDLASSSCGDVLFCGYLAPPSMAIQDVAPAPPRPVPPSARFTPSHARNSSQDYRLPLQNSLQGDANSSVSVVHGAGPPGSGDAPSSSGGVDYRRSHSRTPSLDFRHHSRNSSADLNKLFKIEIGVLNNTGATGSCWVDPLRVRMVKAHHNWIVVAYAHFVTCYRNKDSTGWQLAFTSPHQDQLIERVAINAKMTAAGQQSTTDQGNAGGTAHNKMLAIAYGSSIRLWGVGDDGSRLDVGTFNLGVSVEYLFFIGYQLVALSSVGKIGVWHAMTRNWQTQDVLPVASFDTAGSFLLLGCTNGSIYYIDMQKFPLRMKDNDLLVTELYHDPSNDIITAISVYLTPKTNVCGNWIEIAYGTSSGTVRVIVQHPETVGHGPQLFQTFTVHRHPVTKVRLSEKLLISVCSEYNHVRTWSVMRFRGMISTQPGSTPLSSYKILTIEEAEQPVLCVPHANEIGPYGEQDDEQVFIQKVIPETDQLLVRLASKGKRVCEVKSVDGSSISGFCVHECDGRIGSTRPRRYLFTGHTSGAIQMWDLTTALDMINKPQPDEDGSPEPSELLRMLDSCELSYSYGTTPCVSPSPHAVHYSHYNLSPSLHYTQSLHHNTALHHSATQLLHHTTPEPMYSAHHSSSGMPHYHSNNSLNTTSHGSQQQPGMSSQTPVGHHKMPSTGAPASQLSKATEGSSSSNASSSGAELPGPVASDSASQADKEHSKTSLPISSNNSSINPVQQPSSPPHRPHLPSQSRNIPNSRSRSVGVTHNAPDGVSSLPSPLDPSGAVHSSAASVAQHSSRSVAQSSNLKSPVTPLATSMGHLLKPSNVAFLAHNQTTGSKKGLDKEEGTPC